MKYTIAIIVLVLSAPLCDASTESDAYAARCAVCHGAHGEGNVATGAPNLAGREDWYLARQLAAFAAGVRGGPDATVPAQQMRATLVELADADARQRLVTFIAALPPVDPPATVADRTGTGAGAFLTCAQCHGTSAGGNRALEAPRLAGLADWYVLAQLEAFAAGRRGRHPDDVLGLQMARITPAFLPDHDARVSITAYLAGFGRDGTARSVRTGDAAVVTNYRALDCPTPERQDVALRLAAALNEQKYNDVKLGCAARIAATFAARHPGDPTSGIPALAYLDDYLDYLSWWHKTDYMGDRSADLIVYMEELARQAVTIGDQILAAHPKRTDARLLRVVATVFREEVAPSADASAATRALMAELAASVATDARSLGGLGPMLLGRMKFEVPVFLGGDLADSIALQRQATTIDPTNAQAWRYLAEAYDQDARTAEASAALRRIVPLEVDPPGEQKMADELWWAIGIAERMKEHDLARQLHEKRSKLLAGNPALLTRAYARIGGHGGDLPMEFHITSRDSGA